MIYINSRQAAAPVIALQPRRTVATLVHRENVINKAFSIVDTKTSFNDADRTVSISLFGASHDDLELSVKAHVFLGGSEIPLDLSRFPPKETVSAKEEPEFALILDTWPPGGYEAATS